jgi:hypothetical protein
VLDFEKAKDSGKKIRREKATAIVVTEALRHRIQCFCASSGNNYF